MHHFDAYICNKFKLYFNANTRLGTQNIESNKTHLNTDFMWIEPDLDGNQHLFLRGQPKTFKDVDTNISKGLRS